MEELNLQVTPPQGEPQTGEPQGAPSVETGSAPENAPGDAETASNGDESTEAEESLISEDSPFVQFQDQRNAMIAEVGLDAVKAMDERYANDALTDEDVALIAKAGQWRPQDVKAHLDIVKRNQGLAEKAREFDQQKADAFVAELEGIAGEGGIDGLKGFIEQNASETQIRIWNTTLDVAKQNGDRELTKAVLQEYAAFRDSKKPQEAPAPQKPADLSLLAQASQQPGAQPPAKKPADTPPANPLEGNPLAGSSRQQLSLIQMAGPNHPDYQNAVAVLKVRHPEQV
jgi:hypothetical protein